VPNGWKAQLFKFLQSRTAKLVKRSFAFSVHQFLVGAESRQQLVFEIGI